MTIEWILLSLKSLQNRKLTTFLTVLALTVSVSLLMGIERIRLGVREGFSNTVSQTDLIVGSPNGSLSLLLSSVFHIGSATKNIDINSFNFFKKHPAVKWVIPISIGDSHRGYRVIATTSEYFQNYHYGDSHPLKLDQGRWFEHPFEVVLGSEVAHRLKYSLGTEIVVSHGHSEVSLIDHENTPFKVTGILESTQTPVDRGVYISLESMEEIHSSHDDHHHDEDHHESHADGHISKEKRHEIHHSPEKITFFYVGTKSRSDSLGLMREINQFHQEPLLAIIPSLTLAELWTGMGYAESSLLLISFLVILATLFGLFISLYSSLSERRREMTIYRAIGASPRMIVFMLVFEAQILTLIGTFLGVILTYSFLFLLGPIFAKLFGLEIPIVGLQWRDLSYLLILNFVGFLTGLLVGYKAYKNNLHDGLQVHF